MYETHSGMGTRSNKDRGSVFSISVAIASFLTLLHWIAALEMQIWYEQRRGFASLYIAVDSSPQALKPLGLNCLCPQTLVHGVWKLS